ncbi:MAG TPA: NAD(P)H-dependent oxidoreductase subunit E [Kiritimatiellia bacterium]|nr:NAD(P)H-dependent oxidoreductase subunit E [Kiritimatiellia bacterium]
MHAPAEQYLDEATVDEVIARYPDTTGDVLSILEELQHRHPHQYLPRETLELVSRKTGISRSQIYSVVTFYAFFNLKPQGRHTIAVCRGTACHTRGSRALLESLANRLGIPPSERDQPSFTSPDREVSVRTVACFGQCALAPVVAADEEIHGHMTDINLRALSDRVLAKGARP